MALRKFDERKAGARLYNFCSDVSISSENPFSCFSLLFQLQPARARIPVSCVLRVEFVWRKTNKSRFSIDVLLIKAEMSCILTNSCRVASAMNRIKKSGSSGVGH